MNRSVSHGCGKLIVDHTIINVRATDTSVPVGLTFYEINGNQNLFCTNNDWMGTL